MSAPARSPLTTAAAVLALVVTGFFTWQAVELVRLAGGTVDPETRRRMVMTGVGVGSTTLLVAVGIVMLALCAMTTVLALGLLRRREWAREGALLVFGAFGGVVLALSVGGMLSGAPDAPLGLLVGLADVAVAGLLLSGAVADDIDAAAKARARARGPHRRRSQRQRPDPRSSGS